MVGFNGIRIRLDAGYFTAGICKGLEDRDIYGAIAYRRPNHIKGYLRKSDYTYDPATDCYLCPEGCTLNYRTTDRNGYRHYASDPAQCRNCPLQSKCTKSANFTKVVTRHIWQEHKDTVNSHRYSEQGKKIYKRRKETVERSFADSKQLHGHRYARLRGIGKVFEQCLFMCGGAEYEENSSGSGEKGLITIIAASEEAIFVYSSHIIPSKRIEGKIGRIISESINPLIIENPA